MNSLHEGFDNWPKPAQRLALRILSETPCEIASVFPITSVWNGWRFGLLIDADYDMYAIWFRKKTDQGWRFDHADDGWGHTIRTRRQTLRRLGSNVEIERANR